MLKIEEYIQELEERFLITSSKELDELCEKTNERTRVLENIKMINFGEGSSLTRVFKSKGPSMTECVA